MALLEVAIEGGIVRGNYSGNDSVSVFKGIPYAAPPTEERRWKAPQPVIPWEGVKDCLAFSPICPQEQFKEGAFYAKEFYGVIHPMSEDCLTLNVWTPAESPCEKLPVVFYVHGGGFIAGMGCTKTYDGESFGQKGIITVTFNYRIGCFGFLASEELDREDPNHTSGNYGLLDQIAALKWVRRNIAAFGGDPDRITIMGQSAGGGSVQMLSASPLTRGDVHQTIIQSSMVLVPVGGPNNKSHEDALAFGESFLEECGIKSIEEGRKLSTEELWERYLAYKKGKTPPQIGFKVNVDGYVLTHDQLDNVCYGNYHTGSVLIGCTKDEMDNESWMRQPEIPADASVREKILLNIGKDAERYFEILSEERENAEDMQKKYVEGASAFAEIWTKRRSTPVYQYLFAHEAPGPDKPGAFHSVDLPYIFRTLHRIWRPYRGEDWELSCLCNEYWANYIKTGDPNGEGLPVWTPYTLEKPEVMILKPGAGMKQLEKRPYIRFKEKK